MTIKIPKWLILCIVAFFLSSGSRLVNDLFEFSKNLEIFSAVYKEVGDKYVDEVPPGKLAKTAISAMLSSLDPYTVFFSEYQAEEALIERQGEYGGVGCRVIYRDKFPVISEIIEGYAFDKADIRIGDIITQVGQTNNLQSTENANQEFIFEQFRGAPQSQFTVIIKRGNEILTKNIVRTNVKTKSVPYAGMISNNIGYIKLDEFGQQCSNEIEIELKKLQNSHELKGLVLDLRNNGGGLLNEAVNIVGLFVGENKLVVSLKGKNQEGPKKWITSSPAVAPNLPLVVLVNKNSASASEVVSGSLQDMDRAVIVGQTSFGKGLVQNYSTLPYRTQMKITTARYYTPSGRCIQKLQYDEKDEFGKATVKSNEQKKIFKTKNGRIVYDAGGIDPDVILPLFGGTQMIHWLEKEFFIFDWANKFTQFHPDYLKNPEQIQLNIANSQIDFEQYILTKGPKIMQNNWHNHLRKQGSDSFWTQQMGLYNIDEKKLIAFLNNGLATNKNQIATQLKLALFKRCFKEEKYYANSLKIDNEIERCIEILNAPERIKLILKQ